MTDWRSEWFENDDAVYLNVAGQGPLPRVSIRAAQEAIEWKKWPQRMPEKLFFDLPNKIRELLARMIGGRSDEIALTTGTSRGLAAVALGIDWKPDDEVLLAQGEFPAHFSTFLPLAAAGKLRVKIVKPAGRFLAASDFVAQIGPHTRLVSASLVRFDNAARLDAVTVARACHNVGALLLLDGAQCAGAMPIDMGALEADFLSCSGYKWLLGPYGCGFFWARSELIAQMPLGPFYFMSALESHADFPTLSGETMGRPRGARRWDSPETASFFNLAPLAASLEFLLRAGVDTVWQHNRKLIAEIIERLPMDRMVLASPADADQRGPYVCVAARKAEQTPLLFAKLQEAGVIVSLREGALRIAPHLYNSERDLDRLLAVLAI